MSRVQASPDNPVTSASPPRIAATSSASWECTTVAERWKNRQWRRCTAPSRRAWLRPRPPTQPRATPRASGRIDAQQVAVEQAGDAVAERGDRPGEAQRWDEVRGKRERRCERPERAHPFHALARRGLAAEAFPHAARHGVGAVAERNVLRAGEIGAEQAGPGERVLLRLLDHERA